MVFQRLIWAALATALVVGSAQTGVQRWQTTPLILAAEAYEAQKAVAPKPVVPPAHLHSVAATPHEHGDAKEWVPENGFERIGWTWVANSLHAFSMALLVFAVMGVCLWRGATLRSFPLALWTAAAGWLVFHFWPSLGLPAEIPGMDAARLGSRQGWWLLASVGAALACTSIACLRSNLRWVAAAAWLALPFVVGAPHISSDPLAGFGPEAQTALRQLGNQFIWATSWVALSFWASMGLVGGLAFESWVRLNLLAVLTGSDVADVGPVNKARCR